MRLLIVLFTISCFLYSPYALSQQINCDRENYTCHFEALLQTVKDIENTKWKDQTYKDISVLLTSSNQPLKALKTLSLISNPDTKAMAIRACAKVVAEGDSYKKSASEVFEQLITSADSIEHPPSKAIAYTYIAIAQAEYGVFPNALNTASLMNNESLKNKALAEISKIMAQRNQFNETIEALSSIQSEHYRDKTSLSISKIYSENNQYDEAMKIMSMIHSPYQKSQSLMAIIKNLSSSTRQEQDD